MSKQQYEYVKGAGVNKNIFDKTHKYSTTMNFGDLVPTLCMEVLPGETVKLGNQGLFRMMPMAAPAYITANAVTEYYAVPFRLVWKNWRKYITQTLVAGELPVHPWLKLNGNASGYTKLLDWFGFPKPSGDVVPGTTDEKVSALPLAAFQLIFNEFYRPQNFMGDESENLLLSDGEQTGGVATLLKTVRKKGLQHDMFTSCLPDTQKGSGVDLNLGNVQLSGDLAIPGLLRNSDTHALHNAVENLRDDGTGKLEGATSGQDLVYDPNGSLIVDPIKINDVRRVWAIQTLLEKLMRGGSRYVEYLKTVWGVTSPDARQQRPEFICGVKAPLVISEVLQTSETNDAVTPQGNMAGHGVGVMEGGDASSYTATEHCIVIGVTCCDFMTQYAQGIEKMWLKINDPLEYVVPDMMNIGEQAVKVREVFAHADDGNDTFGYLPYAYEHRDIPSKVTGEMRRSLEFWSGYRRFSTTPSLSEEFIIAPRTTRFFAVDDDGETDHIVADITNHVLSISPVAKFSVPGGFGVGG